MELVKIMKEKEILHKQEMEAAEAELSAEEAEHKMGLSNAVEDEHTQQLKDAHKDIINKVHHLWHTILGRVKRNMDGIKTFYQYTGIFPVDNSWGRPIDSSEDIGQLS